MISITNRIASDRSITVWVVKEDVIGELAYPEDTDIVGAFDITYLTQVPEYENSMEKAQTRDTLNRCQGAMPAGEWGFSTYCRPKGPGLLPQENLLWYGLMGQGIETPADNVTYSLTQQKPSFSIWILVDHTMTYCKGATVGNCELSLEDCSLTFEWSGGFMAMGITGTEVLSADAVAATQILPVANTDKYSLGGLVFLADATGSIVDTNNGAGYIIESIVDNTSLTVSTAIVNGQVAGGFVVPANPGGTLEGSPLETRTAIVTIGTTEKPVVEFTFSAVDEPEYLDREKTPVGHPISYAETQRETTGEVTLAFRRDDADEIKKAYEGVEQPIKLTVGDQAGFIFELDMPRTKSDVPTPDEAEPIVELNIPYTCLGINGEDSYTVIYK